MTRQRIHPRAEARAHLQQPQHQASQGRELFITTDLAAAMLSKPSRAAFRMWAKRRGLTVIKSGGAWLINERDIRAELKRREAVA